MAVFIEARTDPFIENRDRLSNSIRQTRGRNRNTIGLNIRRPTRGILAKPNTYSIIRIMDKDGNFIPVIDAAGELRRNDDKRGYNQFYTNFLVQTVTQQRSEKQQIQETFGDWFIYFFGSSPEIVTVNGALINSADFNWHNEFWENYENYFRGTKLVERGARLYFIFDDTMIEGYMIGANATLNQENLHMVPFSFSIVVMSYSSITYTGDPQYPLFPATNENESYSLIYSAEKKQTSPAAMRMGLSMKGLIGAATNSGATLAASLRASLAYDPATYDLYETFKIARNETNITQPTSPPRYGEFRENIDEFVVRNVGMVNGGRFLDAPSALTQPGFVSAPEEWNNTAGTIDDAVTSSTTTDSLGNSVNTTSSEYSDLMGRSGQAATQTTNRSPGNWSEGLPRTARSRSDPFGMMETGGDLI